MNGVDAVPVCIDRTTRVAVRRSLASGLGIVWLGRLDWTCRDNMTSGMWVTETDGNDTLMSRMIHLG